MKYFDMTTYLKNNAMPTGTYIINGGQKTGKTALMVALLKMDWSYHGAERRAAAQHHIAQLNALPQERPYNLVCPPHLYWSRSTVILRSNPLLKTHRCDIAEMALPDSRFKSQYFPRFSYVIQPEYESLLDSREYKDNQERKKNIFGLIKYAGHNFMTIMLDGQSFDRGDVYVRRLATDVFFIIDQKFIYEQEPIIVYKQRVAKAKQLYKLGYSRSYQQPQRRKRCIGAEWVFSWTKNQIRNYFAALKDDGIEINHDEYHKICKFRFTGDDIRKCYNAFEGEAYFLENIESYDIDTHLEYKLDRDSVSNYSFLVPRKYEKT